MPWPSVFPRLRRGSFAILSPQDGAYNCIAWAAEDTGHWWWPRTPHGVTRTNQYWPPDAPEHETLDSFIAAFVTLNYEVCRGSELEPGLQKIAIYALVGGRPTHAARQIPDGRWTSKLGEEFDIVHEHLDGVAGSDYGDAVVIMRRPSA